MLFALRVRSGQPSRERNADSAHGNVDCVGRERVKNAFSVFEDDRFQGVIVGQHGDGDFSAVSGFSRRGGDPRTERLECISTGARAVKDGERVSGFE